MKFTFATFSLTIALASAQYYNITSKPFQLVLSSENKTIDGDYLSACHTGAAIESLCLGHSNTTSHPNPTPYDTFNFNTSIYSNPPTANPSIGATGIVTWFLPTTPPIPSSITFSYDPITDTALPLFFPGSSSPQFLAFDSNDELNVQGYIDYTTDPPNGQGGPKAYYNWYACRTYYLGYQYQTLTWKLGPGTPQNPSCVKVSVKRVFV